MLMLNDRVSLWDPFRLTRFVCVETVMLVPVENGLLPVKATYAPPSELPDTFADGILFPALSVSAAVVLDKYA